jgi:hypothetical protein
MEVGGLAKRLHHSHTKLLMSPDSWIPDANPARGVANATPASQLYVTQHRRLDSKVIREVLTAFLLLFRLIEARTPKTYHDNTALFPNYFVALLCPTAQDME